MQSFKARISSQPFIAKYGDMLWRIVQVGLVFGVIKSFSFLSVILLSNVVTDVAQYGLFEYALGVGVLLAIVLTAGLQGAYPYFNLKLQAEGFQSLFYLHAAGIAGLTLLFFLGNYWLDFGVPRKFSLAILLGGIVAIQMLLSSILKSHDHVKKAVVTDSAVLLILFFYIVGLNGVGDVFSYDLFELALCSFLFFLLIINILNWWKYRSDFSFQRYVQAVDYGRHIILSAFLVIFLTTGGRILIEYFFDLEAVGYYTFYLRFATLAVIIQQVFLVAFFRKIYQSEPRVLDAWFMLMWGVIFVLILLSWKIIPFVFGEYLTLLKTSFLEYENIYFMLCFHALFWVGIAFNSNVIHREKLSHQMNVHFLMITLIMLVAMFVLHQTGKLSLSVLILTNLAAVFLALESQFKILKKNDVNFMKFKWLTRGGLAFFIITQAAKAAGTMI